VTTIHAHAKLTLSLSITGVREDGFHLIDAVMTSLDLRDEIVITESSTTTLTFNGPFSSGIPTDNTNLISRALAMVGRTADVTVTKNIPHGGGLGGGSSDAAAILAWAGFTDMQAASQLGADIPFCLLAAHTARSARVRGIGEIIEPMFAPQRDVTLIIPPFSVSTPLAYQAWDSLGGPRGENGNDLEPAALYVVPEMAIWRDRILSAVGVRPVLAGSGSTWFIYEHHPQLPDLVADAVVLFTNTRG